MHDFTANVPIMWALQWLLFKNERCEVASMKKIGRPRKADRKENISVNLPKHIVDKINDELSWKSSRSKWIENAIKTKLGEVPLDITQFSLSALLFEARQRDDLDDNVKFVIKMWQDKQVN